MAKFCDLVLNRMLLLVRVSTLKICSVAGF